MRGGFTVETIRTTGQKCKIGSKYLFNIMLAMVLIASSFFYRNQSFTKSMVISCAREAVKISTEFKTINWQGIENENFRIRYQEQDEKIAPMVLKIAEENYRGVDALLGYHVPKKIPIIIYPNKESLNKSFGWDAQENAMGVYWAGVIRVVSPNDWLANSNNMEEDFYQNGPIVHEYTHLVVDYMTKGNYTRWLTEGIAQWVEREITGFVFPKTTVKSVDELYSIKDMDNNFDSLRNQGLAYNQSLSMVDFFLHKYGMDNLRALLTNLGQGKPLSEAFYLVTNQRLDDFEHEFKDYFLDSHLK
jgi:hypothetical protein